MKIVVDTNIIISALAKDSAVRSLIILSNHEFIYPQPALLEIVKHKQTIMKKAAIDEGEFHTLMGKIFERITVVEKEKFARKIPEARGIMGRIDPKDSLFVALALERNAPVWTNDKDFERQTKVKVIKTAELLEGK